MSSCPDRATGRVRFFYDEARNFLEQVFCNRHSWPWRVGRGNGTVETEWL